MTVTEMIRATSASTLDVAMLDFETRKVRIPGGFVRPDTSEVMNVRWQIFAAGVAVDDNVWLVYGDDEAALLAEVGRLIAGKAVYYAATREFDEMLAKGRFTNARRAHLPEPAFPSVPGANEAQWENMAKHPATGRTTGLPARTPGENDLPSRDVPAAWARGERERVLSHLAADVDWLVDIFYSDPDEMR